MLRYSVDDVAYMKGMIPHQSIAILTSERAHVTDQIIESQRKEIAEMKALIDDLERNR